MSGMESMSTRHVISAGSYWAGCASHVRMSWEDGFHVDRKTLAIRVTTGLSRSLDFVADGGDGICVDYLADFFALFDYHEVQVNRRKRIPWDDDYG
jgi:hypothetical protein